MFVFKMWFGFWFVFFKVLCSIHHLFLATVFLFKFRFCYFY